MRPAAALSPFDWKPQPGAQRLVTDLLDGFLARCGFAERLASRMKVETGTRFQDWVDHILVPQSDAMRIGLIEQGFSHRPEPGAPNRYFHEGAIFPTVILAPGTTTRVGIKVDSVADFMSMWQLGPDHAIAGAPGSQFRIAVVAEQGDAVLAVVERHGFRGIVPAAVDPARILLAALHAERFRRRPRVASTDDAAFAATLALIGASNADIGQDWTCDLFFAAEREFWQRRNRAARVQKQRQDMLGLGWANHGHHTYRASRTGFVPLITVLERLGFVCRERFCAGAEADWGAQVLEQPAAGITIFADVDMSPEERLGDFAHAPLPEGRTLGTIGLWCALHGESILGAGMHHLECQFDWHALKEQLERDTSIRLMDPFTSFPFLRQAFTEGERWAVDAGRVERLLAAGQITREQADSFRSNGAVGSHLENLERNDGFKGFNQRGVSEIIAKTDPRKLAQLAGA